jgi:hypothetical protein
VLRVITQVKRKIDPARYQDTAEMTMRDNHNISGVQPLLFVLSMIFTNLEKLQKVGELLAS